MEKERGNKAKHGELSAPLKKVSSKVCPAHQIHLILMLIYRQTRWAESVAGVGVKKCTVQDLMGKLKETDNLEDLDIVGRILK
jgi:hypothetical protein